MKQQQKQQRVPPLLTYDHDLLQEINQKCLQPHQQISIVYLGHFVFEDDDPHEEEVFRVCWKQHNKNVAFIELTFMRSETQDLFHTMKIESKTEQQYRRLHYNTILRCVIVMLMPAMTIQGKKIDKVCSEAQNYLSVYSLSKLGFIAEEFEGFFQGFDLSFYSPFQQTATQHQRITKQKQLHQYIKNKYQNQQQDFHEVLMVLWRKDYHRSSFLAKNILNRLCQDCLAPTTTTKRKHPQQQKQQQKKQKK